LTGVDRGVGARRIVHLQRGSFSCAAQGVAGVPPRQFRHAPPPCSTGPRGLCEMGSARGSACLQGSNTCMHMHDTCISRVPSAPHFVLLRPQNLREAMEAIHPSDPAAFEGREVLRRAQMATLKPGSATVVLAALRPRGCGSRGCGPRGDDAGGEACGDGSCCCDGGGGGCSGGDAGNAVRGGGGGRIGDGVGGEGVFELHISNLGDCGVRVVRQGRVILATQVCGEHPRGTGPGATKQRHKRARCPASSRARPAAPWPAWQHPCRLTAFLCTPPCKPLLLQASSPLSPIHLIISSFPSLPPPAPRSLSSMTSTCPSSSATRGCSQRRIALTARTVM
jgi:hypothetical protein